jgi:cytochrome c biogenesis protein CcmG/thiol:disulfide interchange protein DsbE
MKTKTLILLIIIVAVVAAAFVTIKPSQTLRIAQVGSKPQDFDLVSVNGNKIKLSDMRGSVVFVNFWATWCGSCVEELPSVDGLFKALSGNPSFKMATILFKDNISNASHYMKQNGYSFPVFLNPDESAARIFGITGVPETYIIDKKGVLRYKVLGPNDWASPQTIATLEAIIKEP